MVQLVQADSVLSQAHTTPRPYEADGPQEESLEAARFSDALLSYRRKIVQLSHQQRVLGGQGAVFLQDLGKIAEGQSVIASSRDSQT